MSSAGVFITGTGTDIGKTFVTRGISRFLFSRGVRVSSIKPIETGCSPDPLDAISLARACNNPLLSSSLLFYRAQPPLSPFSISLETGAPSPDIFSLSNSILSYSLKSDIVLVESAGGLLVPLDEIHTNADLAVCLGFPLLVIAPDTIGVLSHTLTLFESAASRDLRIIGLVLVQPHELSSDYSSHSNHLALSRLISCPVFRFPFCPDDDDILSLASQRSGLGDLILSILNL